MKREVRYLYLAVIDEGGRFRDIRKMIAYYEEYNEFKQRLVNDPDCPAAVKYAIAGSPSLKLPKYLIWAKQFIEEDAGEKE